MLKRRLIICLTFNDGVLFRTKRFVPDYRYTQSYLSVESVDEAILIDVTREGPSEQSWEAMKHYADGCFTPVTMGGQIEHMDDVKRMFDLGADKVVVGTGALDRPGFITEIARKYGSQAVTVAVDVMGGVVARGRHKERREIWPSSWALMAEVYGAGELMITDIDRDGSLLGYNIPLLKGITEDAGIPVIIAGGCGGWRSMQEGFEAGADGCVTSVIHHFTEPSLKGFKKALIEQGVPVRP